MSSPASDSCSFERRRPETLPFWEFHGFPWRFTLSHSSFA